MITQETGELEVIKQLLGGKRFHFLLDFFIYPIITGNKNASNDFLYGVGIDRTVLNFESGHKPGDFDLIVIPLKNKQPLIEYTGVLEVKISRPKLKKLGKHPDSSGQDQIAGLIRDDFPFIGLLHLIIPEKDTSTDYIGRFPNGAKLNGVDVGNSIQLEERQVGRIKKLNLPDPVGYSASVFYDYEESSFGGASDYKFCIQRQCDLKIFRKRIDHALTKHPDFFSYYSSST